MFFTNKAWNFLNSPPACLVPGAGLGRLALEISCLGAYVLPGLHGNYDKYTYIITNTSYFNAGFISQGNEFSYYMMICSSFILNQYEQDLSISCLSCQCQSICLFVLNSQSDDDCCSLIFGSFLFFVLKSIFLHETLRSQTAGEWTIYPWIHSNCNSLSDSDQLRPVSIPDIHPARYW